MPTLARDTLHANAARAMHAAFDDNPRQSILTFFSAIRCSLSAADLMTYIDDPLCDAICAAEDAILAKFDA